MNKSITSVNLKYIIIIFVLIILIFKLRYLNTKSLFTNAYSFFNKKTKIFSNSDPDIQLKIKYKKCGYLKLQNTLTEVFEKYNFESVDEEEDNDWDVYIPCGYNYAETELKKIKISHPNQKVYAIRGCDKIASKNELWKIISDFYGREEASKLIPESYIINNPKDIQMFKKKYNKNNLYLLKKNIQRKEGILITNDYKQILNIVDNTTKSIKDYYNNIENNKTLDTYVNKQIVNTNNTNNDTEKDTNKDTDEEDYNKNQKMNSLINNYKIIQTYINDLYIIKNRKCNIRLYLLIICNKGDKQAYLYNFGKCIYTNKDFDKDSDNNQETNNKTNNKVVDLDKEKHLTSYLLDQDIYKTHPETLDDLKTYMSKEKYDCLWNQIMILFTNVMHAVKGNVCNSKKLNDIMTFQLFGADIIFTRNLHPYLLELNKGPSMKYMNPNDKKMKLQLTEDLFKQVGIIPFQKKEESNFTKI